MKSCLRVPRVLIPSGEEYRRFAVIKGDKFRGDRNYWMRVEREAGDAPSALHFILPDVYAGEDDDARAAAIRESIYGAFESRTIEKLARGFLLTERETSFGMRRGIVAAVDLECYSNVRGESAPVRPCMQADGERTARLLSVRRASPAEFPATVLLYRDKRNKVLRDIAEEDLEQLYDFRLMQDGGRLRGFFIPDYIAEDLIYELTAGGDPCLAVADGAEEMAAAKAHWEEVKATLSAEETRTHPARFTLAELVNVYDGSVVFRPVHRLVTGVDKEAFLDFFTHTVKSKREGDCARVLLTGAEAIEKTDAAIARFLHADGGAVSYVADAPEDAEEDCACVLLKAFEKEDVFGRLKGGGCLPAHAFRLGEESDARYSLEGKEISYD